MLNELYTFAEPVQVVPFSSLKWGKFTLLHTNKWYYGHFHQKWTWKYEDTYFKMLDIMEFATVRTINYEDDD